MASCAKTALPTIRARLRNFLSGMLTRLGTDNQGRPYVDAVEVWNEPNLLREWYGTPMTGEYLYGLFQPRLRGHPRVFARHHHYHSRARARRGLRRFHRRPLWLQQLYGAGLAQYGTYVAVGIHPYGWANTPDARCCANPSRGWDNQPQFFFLDTIEDYRAIMVANGHGSAQLWTTEFGWATFEGLNTRAGVQPTAPGIRHISPQSTRPSKRPTPCARSKSPSHCPTWAP